VAAAGVPSAAGIVGAFFFAFFFFLGSPAPRAVRQPVTRAPAPHAPPAPEAAPPGVLEAAGVAGSATIAWCDAVRTSRAAPAAGVRRGGVAGTAGVDMARLVVSGTIRVPLHGAVFSFHSQMAALTYLRTVPRDPSSGEQDAHAHGRRA
jgi:hypothetical protein